MYRCMVCTGVTCTGKFYTSLSCICTAYTGIVCVGKVYTGKI